MAIRFASVKALVWCGVILLLVLSFPLQVYANSPYPSLLPYLLVALLFFSSALLPRRKWPDQKIFRSNRNIDLLVAIYVFLVLFHTGWQSAFEVISVVEAMSALAIYLLPSIFYWYFRQAASEYEIRWVLSAMVVGGLIVGIYFAYDSFLKLALGEISEYAKSAFQYSLERKTDSFDQASDARINLGSRAFGLLQTHSVSGSWVALGAFATLALIPFERRLLRQVCILIYGAMLLVGLNFTSILAYAIVVILFEFDGILLLQGRLSGKLVRNLGLSILILSLLILILFFWVISDAAAEIVIAIFSTQSDILLTTGAGNESMFGLLISTFENYIDHISDFPPALIFGDGFSIFGFEKGGDVGAIETLAQFGIPYYLIVLLGLFRLMSAGMRRIKELPQRHVVRGGVLDDSRMIRFSICSTLLVLIMDGHYSVWGAKAVLPIIFFVLAIYGRYVPAGNQHGIAKSSR